MSQTRPRVIRGTVRDRTGPVAGSVVSFVAGPTALPDIATLSDAASAFALSAPVPGRYSIVAGDDVVDVLISR